MEKDRYIVVCLAAGCCFAFSNLPALQSFKARGGFLYGQIAISRAQLWLGNNLCAGDGAIAMRGEILYLMQLYRGGFLYQLLMQLWL